MDTRGVAQTLLCPRCGTEMPPADVALVTCPICKLAFTPANHTRDDSRPFRLPRAPTDDITRERIAREALFEDLREVGVHGVWTDTSLTLRFGEWRRVGVVGLAGAALFTLAASQTSSIVEHLLFPALAGASGVLGATFSTNRSLSVDHRGIARKVWPWPARRFDPEELARFSVEDRRDNQNGAFWTVEAYSRVGDAKRLFATPHSREAAELVARTLEGALTSFSAAPRS